jgi:hypothetical protein
MESFKDEMPSQAFAGELMQKPHSPDSGRFVKTLQGCRKRRIRSQNGLCEAKSLATQVFAQDVFAA